MKSPDWLGDNHRGTAKLRRQRGKGSIHGSLSVAKSAGGFFGLWN